MQTIKVNGQQSEHTPGPWAWDENTQKVWGADDTEVCRPTYRAGSPEQRGANARLIAAAPELLAALRDAIMWVDDDDQGAPEYKAKWRAVIAKAEGRNDANH